MAAVSLIFCADGNQRHAQLAVAAGWLYGARLPARGLAPLPLSFADQDWRKPDRAKYMACLAQHRPALATVLDWEHPEQLPEVLSWAEEAAQHVRDAVLVIPKVPGAVARIPRRIGGKDVWLAYSVPTRHGASPLFLSELAGWPLHLLGGSPQAQRECWRYLRGIADVRSMDGNMTKKMATSRCLYWTEQKSQHGHWQPINRAVEHDAPDECVRRSLANIMGWWREAA
jgi:uncharacterized protein DUF6610